MRRSCALGIGKGVLLAKRLARRPGPFEKVQFERAFYRAF